MKDMTLNDFLCALATATGDEAIELVDRFQSGSLTVEGIGVEDFE